MIGKPVQGVVFIYGAIYEQNFPKFSKTTYEDGDLRTIHQGGFASKTVCGFLESDSLAINFGI